MARFENKKMKRFFDPLTGADTYEMERGSVEYDLSGLRFLHTGVDTIRQLYNCTLKSEVLQQIASHYDTKTTDVIEIAGIEWKLSSSGKKSGYQYILKNLDIGMVVLLKSFYKEADQQGPHMKIEVTPQLIDELGLEQLTNRLREVGRTFGDTLEASGMAVHLCVDMKGLVLPEDFESMLATRSKRNLKVNAISNAHFEVAEASFVYGRGQTYLFGNSSSLQMCLYNKSEEAVKSDKLDFCESQWRATPSLDDPFTPEYKDGRDGGEVDTVHRLEFRVHHSVLKEFENGNYNRSAKYNEKGEMIEPGKLICIREPRDLKPHLQALWDYCLNNFRLHHSSTYIHPIWQKLMEDVSWFNVHPTFIYARDQKKSAGVAGRRNVAMWLGNHLRLAARKGFTTKHVVQHLLSSGLESDLADYFGLLYYGHSSELFLCLTDFVDKRLRDHRLNGVAA